jgi:putative peptidoglycan lipid II flippase
MISMLVNRAGNLILIMPLQHMGPPLATAIASTVNVWMLYRELRRRGDFAPDDRLKRRAVRLFFSAIAMGLVLWATQGLVMPWVHGHWMVRAAALALLVISGALVYGVATFALGAFTRDDLQFLRRKRAS